MIMPVSGCSQLLRSSYDMQNAIEMLLRVCSRELQQSPGIVVLAEVAVKEAEFARKALYEEERTPRYVFKRLSPDDTEGGSA